MKFTFKNLGYVKEGSIELADLTIICGPNNAGKTYLSYAIYGFLKHFPIYQKPGFRIGKTTLMIEPEAIEELIKVGTLSVDLMDFFRHINLLFKKSSQSFSQDLEQFFSAPSELFNLAEMAFSFADFQPDFTKQFTHLANVGTGRIYFEKSQDSRTMQITLQQSGDNPWSVDVLHNLVSSIITEYTCAKALPRPFVITSERTGIALFYKELDIHRNAIVEQLVNSKPDQNTNMLVLVGSAYSRYAEPIKDNINTIRDYDQLNKQKSFLRRDEKNRYKPVFDALQSIMGGNFKSTDNQVLYRPKKIRGQDEILIPVYLASSSVKSLFLLDFYINCLAVAGDLLVIDEPELNLHPDNQRKMAGLLARLVNSGVKVLITTHSDYLIREINNRIMLSNELENKAELMQQQAWVELDILRPHQVAAYTVGAKRTVERMTIDRFGIELKIFEELIAQANQAADDTYYRIRE